MAKKNIVVKEIEILGKIHLIREEKVMLDYELAELYGVETKYLKRQVRRNAERFPEDFMFELTKSEFDNLRSQIGTSSWGGTRYAPMVFTENGVAMLSSVLKSGVAINVNIQIMRLFTRMRKLIEGQKELIVKFTKLEKSVEGQGHEIQVLFEYIKKLIESDQKKNTQSSRKKIGFKKK